MTNKPTPRETLSRVLDTQLDCESTLYADACIALEDVKALVVVLLKYPHQHDHRCHIDGRPKGVSTVPVCGIPEATAKLTKVSHAKERV